METISSKKHLNRADEANIVNLTNELWAIAANWIDDEVACPIEPNEAWIIVGRHMRMLGDALKEAAMSDRL